MADESQMVDGAMIAIADRVYFIPRDELRSYRVPDEVADAVHEQLAEEVSGFSIDAGQASVFGVRFDPLYSPKSGGFGPKEPLQFSSLIMHCVTVRTA